MLLTTDHVSKKSGVRTVGRALLIVAYGVACLPTEGLTAMEEALGIKIQDELQKCYDLIIKSYFLRERQEPVSTSSESCELFDVVLEGLS